MSLDHVLFVKSGMADAASNIRLAIVNNFFLNLDGFTTSSDAFVGLSTNTVASTAGIATGSPIIFNFDHLPLTYGENYAAIFVNVSGTSLNRVLVSALTANYSENPPGTGMYLPITNYGDPDPNFPGNFALATSNFAHTDSFGTFFDTFGGQGDAVFRAYFNQVGPLGDYNGNGVVDGADYVVWRKYNTLPLDFNIWRANFGTTNDGGASAGLAGTSTVAEPSTLAPTCTFAVFVWLRNRRGDRRH